jgi:hypothetical protein
MEAILGGVVGGLLRVVPEVLGFFDRKGERKHEQDMSRLSIEQIRVEGSIRMDEKRADFAIAELAAIQEGVKEQGETSRASYRWVSAISALVRPTVTWGLCGMYAAVKYSLATKLVVEGMDPGTALRLVWTNEDMALMSMVLNFWFVGRVWERVKAGS